MSAFRFTFLAFSASQCSENTQRYMWYKVSPSWKGKIFKFFSKIAVFSEIPSCVHTSKKQEHIPCVPLPLGLLKSCPCVKWFCIHRPLGYCDCRSQEGTAKAAHSLRRGTEEIRKAHSSISPPATSPSSRPLSPAGVSNLEILSGHRAPFPLHTPSTGPACPGDGKP